MDLGFGRVIGFTPDKYQHVADLEAANITADRLASLYGERFWVTRDGGRGWYVCPASEKRKWLTDTASD